MGLLDRLRRSGGDDEPVSSGLPDPGPLQGADDGVDDGGIQAPSVHPLGEADEQRLEAARAGYARHGIDPTDLASIGRAHDNALARRARGETVDSADLVEVLGAAIGDHLCHAAGYRWRIVEDVFGSDLGVEAPRRGTSIPHSITAVRWMQQEPGWVPAVVGHLVTLGSR